MNYYQQGDVLLIPIDKLPEGKNMLVNGEAILAKGETTGHAHKVTVLDRPKCGIQFIERDGKLYLGVADEVEVVHEEHNKILLPAGNYEIAIIKEYDHFAEEARQVMD